MTFSLRSKTTQQATPDAIADSFEQTARRWKESGLDDHAVGPLIVAAGTIRGLGKQCLKLQRNVAILTAWTAVARRELRLHRERSSAELASQAATISQLQAQVVQLKSDVLALTAVAARPDPATIQVEATLEQRDSRTRHLRDAAGELVESQTTYE